LTLTQQLSLFAVAVLTSKGASGVQGASFIALVSTLMVVPSIPVAGMALILGIDRFMSMFRAAINVIGNCVATLVIAVWEREMDRAALREALRARLAAVGIAPVPIPSMDPVTESGLTSGASGM
jgi:aerobic C4-dicarboxylate transport protein